MKKLLSLSVLLLICFPAFSKSVDVTGIVVGIISYLVLLLVGLIFFLIGVFQRYYRKKKSASKKIYFSSLLIISGVSIHLNSLLSDDIGRFMTSVITYFSIIGFVIFISILTFYLNRKN